MDLYQGEINLIFQSSPNLYMATIIPIAITKNYLKLHKISTYKYMYIGTYAHSEQK